MGSVVKRVAGLALVALLAGCGTGYSHLGLSREEHRAYARSDSSCDGGARARDAGPCSVPGRD